MEEEENMSNDEVIQFIEVWEGINSEIKDARDRLKEHKQNIKSRGYDVKIMGKVVKDRARNIDDIKNEEAMIDTYRAAAGMEVE